MSRETITLGEFQARVEAQGQDRQHTAFVCPICGTVQSMASLERAGVPAEKLETQIGFSCEGRWTGAGPWHKSPSGKRQAQRGCDWTLGGLFRLHTLTVIADGQECPTFELASPEQAEALRASLVLQS